MPASLPRCSPGAWSTLPTCSGAPTCFSTTTCAFACKKGLRQKAKDYLVFRQRNTRPPCNPGCITSGSQIITTATSTNFLLKHYWNVHGKDIAPGPLFSTQAIRHCNQTILIEAQRIANKLHTMLWSTMHSLLSETKTRHPVTSGKISMSFLKSISHTWARVSMCMKVKRATSMHNSLSASIASQNAGCTAKRRIDGNKSRNGAHAFQTCQTTWSSTWLKCCLIRTTRLMGSTQSNSVAQLTPTVWRSASITNIRRLDHAVYRSLKLERALHLMSVS